MPIKNPFGRRKSSGNPLDFQSEVPPADQPSSFRVIERPQRTNLDAAQRSALQNNRLTHIPGSRPFNSPIQQIRGQSAEDLGYTNRGSGGTTNSGSGSSGYYESSAASARYSSTSTLPSSLDQEGEPEEEELFPKKRPTAPMHASTSAAYADDYLPPPPSFSNRASRAFSFGRNKPSIPKPVLPPSLPASPAPALPNHQQQQDVYHNVARPRTTTESSYASTVSTVVPPRLETKPDLGSSDFGNDFGSMFDKPREKKSHEALPAPPPTLGGFHRTESEPMFPPRSYSRQGALPSPNSMRNARDDAGSPYGDAGRNSHDGLVSNSSALNSPLTEVAPPPPQATGLTPAFLGGQKQGYSLVPERYASPGPERQSHESQQSFMAGKQDEAGYESRQTHLADVDRWPKKYDLQDNNGSTSSSSNSYNGPTSYGSNLKPQPQASSGALRPGAISPGSSEGGSQWGNESRNTTPRATKLQPQAATDDSLFDVSPAGPASRAARPGTSSQRQPESGTPKKMTKAQFEAQKRYQNASAESSDHDDAESVDDYDDDDDIERAKRLAHQRKKQEATMSVYRQQMKKSTGGGLTDLPANRPGLERNSSSIHFGGIGGQPPADAVRGVQGNDEDEDVPLGILQAHGFPSSSRPPTAGQDMPGFERSASAGSVINGGAGQGNLPPFARRLPADPYFGAGLVNPANREPMAFSSAGSVYGAPPSGPPPAGMPGGHPGGLVGVIAGEERARAARRGSPNPNGGYGPIPLPTNMMPQQMPNMARTMSLGNVVPPMFSPGAAPPMPIMPGMPMMSPMTPGSDQNTQMQQFMQMQMQLMQNMMNMQQAQMSGQMPPQQLPQSPSQNFLVPPGSMQRPMSMASQAPSFQQPNQGRSMTMMGPPGNWGNGMQRPVSTLQPHHSYSSGLNAAPGPGQGYTPSIAPSERSNVGMPSRYRPVQNGTDANGRSHSMTSAMTLQAFQNQQPAPAQQENKTTIRIIDKPKGSPKVTTRPVDAEDDDEGWAEMAKKRSEKKFTWRKKEKTTANEPALSDLYQTIE